MLVNHGPSQQGSKKNTSHGNKCYDKILGTSYKDTVTDEKVCAKIQQAIGLHEDDLTIIKNNNNKN